MKTAKPRAEAHERKRPSGRKPSGKVAIIPPEARRSTAGALLKHAPGWTGNDLEDVIATVKGTRTKTRF
jgi:hypothetical protein